MPNPLSLEAIGPETTEQLTEFFTYLREHVAENGSPGTGYFQPLSREASVFPAEREERFRNALAIEVGSPGWRRLWVARTPEGRIAGHVDLRGHADPHTAHRCLLGIGVHSAGRRNGVGAFLLENARHWARSVAGLEWIDLQVLSVNQAARRLYHRVGFVTIGEVLDMFKIDGQSFGYTYMALRLGAEPQGGRTAQGV